MTPEIKSEPMDYEIPDQNPFTGARQDYEVVGGRVNSESSLTGVAPRTKRKYVKSGKYSTKNKTSALVSESDVPPDMVEQERMALFNAAFAGPSRRPSLQKQPPEVDMTDETTLPAGGVSIATSGDTRAVDTQAVGSEFAAPLENHAHGHSDAEGTTPAADVQDPPNVNETGAGASRSSSHQESVPPVHDMPAVKSQVEEPSAEAEYSMPPDDILDRATILINWNAPSDWNVDLDVNDWTTMADCACVEDFFALIEGMMPGELVQRGGRIVQVKVKMMEGGTGPKYDCRILRDDRGRGALRQMLKKLRVQCETCEPELRVEVVAWE